VLNAFFNELAYDPPGDTDSFLFWSGWGAHNGVTATSVQDAHGPVLRGIILLTCVDYDLLYSVAQANPFLAMLTRMANFPPEGQVCPGNAEGLLEEVPLTPPTGASR
jgi:phospholipid/cholesterol/gamma-HCH transport system substrate-binding protein